MLLILSHGDWPQNHTEGSENNNDRPMWDPSSTEEEDWDADDGPWEAEIIGEEVAMHGWGKQPDIRYKARWKNARGQYWKRSDGTGVTWNNTFLHPNDINAWENEQAERRQKLAELSTDVDVNVLNNINIHLTATQYREHAVEEKIKRERSIPYAGGFSSWDEWTEHNLSLAMEGDSDDDGDPGAEGDIDEEGDADLESDEEEPRPPPRPRGRSRKSPPIPSSSQEVPLSSASTSSTTAGSSNSIMPGKRTLRRTDTSSTTSESVSLSQPRSSFAVPQETGKRILRRTDTASTSEYVPSSQSNSSFVVPQTMSAKAKGKQKAVPATPIVISDDDLDILSLPKGQKRARSPSLTQIDEDLQTEVILSKRSNLRPSPKKISRKRKELEKEWTHAAQRTGAARLTLTNTVDNEEIPSLPKGFRYLESEYRYSTKVRECVPEEIDGDLFVRCECKRKTRCTAQCSCQELSELFVNGTKVLAYTRDRLFNAFDVPRGFEVIECNDRCSCDRQTCPNRVAQQPRDVPIDIFKTSNRGWGVCSPVSIKKGKVLGIYTGLLIRREAAAAFTEDQKEYLFDIDGREAEGMDMDAPENLYSVDSSANAKRPHFGLAPAVNLQGAAPALVSQSAASSLDSQADISDTGIAPDELSLHDNTAPPEKASCSTAREPVTVRMNSFRAPGDTTKMEQPPLYLKLNMGLQKQSQRINAKYFLKGHYFPPYIAEFSVETFVQEYGKYFLTESNAANSLPRMGLLASEEHAAEYLNHIVSLFYRFMTETARSANRVIEPKSYWTGSRADKLLRVGPSSWDAKPDILLAPVQDRLKLPSHQIAWPWGFGCRRDHHLKAWHVFIADQPCNASDLDALHSG
ncbi:hypothetical protein H0H92_007695 [Tricholoma furcatifolium]|nr:hypothetical protein H0H92_007695 [Tricholoma furcatifolium]